MQRIYSADAFNTRLKVPSYWEATAIKPSIPYPGTDGSDSETIFDVVIIGGGFTGQNAALELSQTYGMRVAILEAGEVGWGASGRNGGFCGMGGSKLTVEAMAAKFGTEQTNHFTQIQMASVEHVHALIDSANMEVDACGQGEIYLAHKPRIADAYTHEAHYLQTFGINARLFNPGELREQGYHGHFFGGMHVPVGFGLHPLKYTYGLYTACLRAGVSWQENSPVTHWQKEAGFHLLHIPNGVVRARKVIIATNGYTPEDLTPTLRGRLLPAMSSILVTRPLTNAELQAQGWSGHTMSADSRTLLHYFRLLPDKRFLFGGRGGMNAADSSLPVMQAWLGQAFGQMFPAWADVEHEYFWRGFVCLSRQLTPHIGQQDTDPTVYHALAYHGSGIAMGSWAGSQVAKLLTGANHQIPGFMRQQPAAFALPALRTLYLRSAYWGYQLRDEWGVRKPHTRT